MRLGHITFSTKLRIINIPPTLNTLTLNLDDEGRINEQELPLLTQLSVLSLNSIKLSSYKSLPVSLSHLECSHILNQDLKYLKNVRILNLESN